MLESPRLLSLDQVGRALGMSTYTAARYVTSGRLPAVRIGGRVRVDQADLAAFCEAQRAAAAPAVPVSR
jgi:excisionase family DNA binding protein